ncbi:histidine kinase sensor domain-containing protein [Aliamphritea spongicola]|uniref:histidine kinase sensor domain-containing protein n=1 Tax=Aliamphritea spongicola TaxID=707589 RepID=UPI00196A7C3D|nr:histidine kinase sensor domain-containing protein [Aliamphritea spongicola]MBN3562245.1 histidine kinase sensor domain-containing protein [Aliamphritea spongicola]
MSRKLFWKLSLILSLGSIVLVWLVSTLSLTLESNASKIAAEHKAELRALGQQAEHLIQQGDRAAASRWVNALRAEEGVFVSIVRVHEETLVDFDVEMPRGQSMELGRSVEWGIHLYHDNPLMELPFSDGSASLVIELPQRMRPGQWWPYMHFALHTLVPLLLMIVISVLLYRHVMRPLQQLEHATRQFMAGDFAIRVGPQLKGRSDELARLAATFDAMAARIGSLIQTQRHLINDLSHELRTPLQRLNLALSSGRADKEQRIYREAGLMQKLVEDTLSLAWLDNAAYKPEPVPVDIRALLEVIVDDARYEYPDRDIQLQVPDQQIWVAGSERSLGQACENIIRNAVRHSPDGPVTVRLIRQAETVEIWVRDQGPGVPEKLLDAIFKPFFRVDKSRERETGGFGLGLALARRQLESIAARVKAQNCNDGLEIIIDHLQIISPQRL